MNLSLSVRIVEAACKSRLLVPFEPLAELARDLGYQAVCMRASAGGVGTPPARLAAMRRHLDALGLPVSMVTADVAVPLNNDRGPDALRDIDPSLDVAEAFGCTLLRVCLKRPEDVPFARAAADRAARRGIRLAHQCHHASLFEEVDAMLAVLAEIDRPNVGLTYEPVNLFVCGQSYGRDTFAKLRPHLMNVYVQNLRLDPHGPETLTTYNRGEVRFHNLDPWEPGGIDFAEVMAGVKEVGYNGYFTIHQAQGIDSLAAARDFAGRCAAYFRALAGG